MPPLPVVPNVCKLTVEGVYHDTIWNNIFFVHYSGATPSSTTLLTYLSPPNAWSIVDNAYSVEMSVDNSFTALKIEDLSSSSGASAEYSGSPVFGGRSGDFQGANVAVVASAEISRRYRGGHPRKYFSWGTAGTMASGSTKDWDSGFVASCQSSLNTMVADLAAVTVGSTNFDQLVNVSYYTAGARRVTAQVDDITSWVVRTRICSQRRRLGKVGG